jgi:hypothetical protein
LGEENFLDSPLDKIEPYQLFKATLLRMQQEQPQTYASLIGRLSAQDQSVIQAVMVKADEVQAEQIRLQQQAQATLLAAAQQPGNPPPS